MEQKKDKGFLRRIIALAVLVGIVLLFFLIRLVQFQLVEGEKYYSEATAAPSSSATASSQAENF